MDKERINSSSEEQNNLYEKINRFFNNLYIIFTVSFIIILLFFISYFFVLWNAVPAIIIYIIVFNIAGQIVFDWKRVYNLFLKNEYAFASPEERDDEAKSLIKKVAAKVAVETMLSPWPIVDAIIVLIESSKLIFTIRKIYPSKFGLKNSFVIAGQVTAALVLAFQMEKYDKYAQSALRSLLANSLSNITSSLISKFGVEIGKSFSNATMISWLGLTLYNIARESSKKVNEEKIKELGESAKKEARSKNWIFGIGKEMSKMGYQKCSSSWQYFSEKFFEEPQKEGAEV
jgi:hypothetical protein